MAFEAPCPRAVFSDDAVATAAPAIFEGALDGETITVAVLETMPPRPSAT
jgi:hypothetical protein